MKSLFAVVFAYLLTATDSSASVVIAQPATSIPQVATSVSAGGVDFSTITTAIALKVDKNSPDQVNLSTVTTAIALKVDKNAPDQVNLSTVTTALAGKQTTGDYITALTGGITATGPGSVSATVITNANLTGNVTSVGNATTLASIPAISGANLTNLTGANVTGTVPLATALNANGTNAGSSFVCLGVDASGNCETALVDAAAVSASTNPIQSGALFTHAALSGSSAHSATSANTASQIVTRDGSGNFSAGTITASLTGSASLNVLKTGDTMTGQLTNTSTITVQGNAFSVGTSTFVVTGGSVGVGTSNPGTKLHLSSGTLTIDGTAGAIRIGEGTPVFKIQKLATVSTDLGGATTATCTAETNFSMTGVAVGDACTVSIPAAIAATDWIECRTLADNVALKYCTQGVGVDPAAMVFHITTIEY